MASTAASWLDQWYILCPSLYHLHSPDIVCPLLFVLLGWSVAFVMSSGLLKSFVTFGDKVVRDGAVPYFSDT